MPCIRAILTELTKQRHMKSILAALSTLALALPATATPQSPDYHNAGQCAGDQYSKCRYSLEIVNPNEPMIVLPAFEELGASRLSTIEWCSEVVGKTYDELITDSDFESYEACLIEHT
jgi:hypothetical protein